MSVTLTDEQADGILNLLRDFRRSTEHLVSYPRLIDQAIAALTREPEAGVSSRAELLKLFEAVELAVDRIDGVDAYAQGGYRQAAREYDEARRAMKAALTREEPAPVLPAGKRALLVRAIEKVRKLSNWRFVEGYVAASVEDLQLVYEMEDALTREEPAKCAGCKDDLDFAAWVDDPEKQGETLEELPDPPPHTCAKARPSHPDPALSRGTPASPLNEPLNVATHRVAPPAPPGGWCDDCQTRCTPPGYTNGCPGCDPGEQAKPDPATHRAAPRCFGCEDRPFGALWAEDARPHTCAKAVAGAAPKPEPATCQHREALEHSLQFISNGIEPEAPMDASTASILSTIGIALSQPCPPAQSDAGEWEPVQELRLGETRYVEIGSLGLYRRRAKGGGAQ